jgi:hypothetical protein
MGVKLVALDIDGTILPPGAPPGAEPSPRLKRAVVDLQRAGTVVVRLWSHVPGTAEIARHLGIRARRSSASKVAPSISSTAP